MFAPGVPELMDEFNSTSKTLGSFVVSVFLLGFAFGPLILAPLSELYGRLVVYHATNIGFLVFNVACAEAPNLSTLIAMRFLAGCMGAACITNGGGTVADLIPQQKRGLFMALFAMGPLLGPVVGPVAGGYIAESIGWRWTFWILVCLTGAFSIVSLIFLRETYAPVIIERKAARLRKETGNNEYRSKLDVGLSKKDVFTMSIVRPMKLLLFSPIVMILSLYLGVLYGYMYLLFTTFTVVFTEQYGFSSGSVGLSFLGIGIGSLVGLGLIGGLSDRLLKSRARANSPPGTPDAELNMKPEYRLPMLQPFAILVVGGLFLYGWTAEYKVHWIVPILGTGIVGACMMVAMMCIQTYLVDAFTIYAASAIAANTVIRSMLGALLPLAGQDMYAALGLGWGNSLLAFIALAMAWVPWALGRWGETIRTKYPVKL
jgi:multidrug resistance protein